MQPVFESWDLTPRVLKPRSRLYSPAPEGMGTAFVESLSGYIVRLAEAHAVTTGDLVHRELFFQAGLPLVLPTGSHRINGLENRAARWVKAVETATLRSDLRYLTLLPFRHLLPTSLLLRKTRAWCPDCFAEMAATGTVYEPLLWCLRLVEACPRHRRHLVTTCSHCRQSPRPLYVSSRTGRCPKCGMELSGKPRDPAHETPDPIPSEYQLWLADAWGQLLAHAPEVRPEILPDRVRDVLVACTEAFAGGNRAAVAETVQCYPQVFGRWFDGHARPRADNLLRAWYQLKLPVSLIFSPNGELSRQVKGQTTVRIQRVKNVVPRRSREQLRRTLREALNEHPSPSVAEVARRLGYVKPYWLYTVDAALCARITMKYRRPGRIDWWRKRGIKRMYALPQVKMILEDYLSSQGRIPPLIRIALSLGYANDYSLRRQFPELWRALAARIARQRAERPAVIGPALEQALQESPPPSIRKVCQRVRFSSSSTLKAHAPVLYARLIARYKEYAEVRRAELHNKLKAALNEAPPPPPKEVCARLGITVSTARRNFPKLHRAVVVRYGRYKHQQVRARREAVEQEIPPIVSQLHEQGICPSVPRVRSLLKSGSILNWNVLGEAVNDARRALGIS